MIELTQDTVKLIDLLFHDSKKKEGLKSKLMLECAENIPFCKNLTPKGLERLRFAIIKLSHEDNNIEAWFNLAKTDWRDLLISAGFESDANEHNNWKNKVLNND